MLPRVKYTFCIPIKKGWVTAKFWEMAHYGIIPFLHPTYDEQKHLDVPAFLRVKDSKELFDKIKFLEENTEAYDQLRDAIDKALLDEYYDGTYMNRTLLEGIEEIVTK
jgi:predicted CoA-binding protein